MESIDGYALGQLLHEGDFSKIYRGQRISDQQAVILKCLNIEHPKPAELARFRREKEITDLIDSKGVVKVLGLESFGNSLVIILEDFGGESLNSLLKKGPLALATFLPLAISASQTLADIHKKHIIHKDINPANILWNRDLNQLKIIDFGISTRLSREVAAIQNANVLEGTLAYISPEQTGRLNRSIDYRTDFYSLGATFYELLTGLKPFESDDAMELVHSHIAQEAKLVDACNPAIPHVVAMIINKLLAKKAEDRYQSAYGLAEDLKKCLAGLSGAGSIEEFVLGTADYSDQLSIPQVLYGRDAEISVLLDAFDRASDGSIEFLAVAGFSGIGKSSLINEIHKPIVARRGYFIGGKFDQLNKNLPYSAIIQALQDFARQILTTPADELALWKQRMLDAVGEQGQIIIDVVPEIEWIIGPQPVVPDMAGSEAKNRFISIFQSFIQAIAQKEHPLVLFIDDLQWVDAASLALIRLIRFNPQQKYLLLIGAYRDNEVQAGHPLIELLDEFNEAGYKVDSLLLGPLTEQYVNVLVSDALHCDLTQAADLARLIFGKTKGNPFFVNQFLSMLHQEALIQYNQDKAQWHWQIDVIEKKQMTENVVDLLTYKIKLMPAESQKVLSVAAAIGNQFEIKTLAAAYGQNQRQTMQDLWPFVEAELLVPLNNAYADLLQEDAPLAQHDVPDDNDAQPEQDLTTSKIARFAFQHDRVQQAAYSLIPDHEQTNMHYVIGMSLLKDITATQLIEPNEDSLHEKTPGDDHEPVESQKPAQQQGLDAKVFNVVNQLNPAMSLLADQSQRRLLCMLNLRAGLQAKKSTAYPEAYGYFKAGISLLPDDGWSKHYALTFALYINATEVSLMTADYDGLEVYSSVVIEHGINLLDRMRAYEPVIDACLFKGDLVRAIKLSILVSGQLGIKFPKKPTRLHAIAGLIKARHQISKFTNDEILSLPLMTDPGSLIAMRILNKSGSAAITVSPDFLLLCIFKRVELSLKLGYAPETIAAFGGYACVLCIFNRIDEANKLADLLLIMLEKSSDGSYLARNAAVHAIVRSWKLPYKELTKPLKKGYFSGVESGDWEFSVLCMEIGFWCNFFSGNQLGNIQADYKKYYDGIEMLGQKNRFLTFRMFRQFHHNLSLESSKPFNLAGDFYDESTLLESHISLQQDQYLSQYYILKMIGCYLMSEYELAMQHSIKAIEYVSSQKSLPLFSQCYFYQALANISLVLQGHTNQPASYIKTTRKKLKTITIWAKYSAANQLNKKYLLEALLAQSQHKNIEAENLFNKSITAAKKYQLVHEEALAYQLFSEFQLSMQRPKYAKVLMQESHYLFDCWGAQRKCWQLQAKHPEWQLGNPNTTLSDKLFVPVNGTIQGTAGTNQGLRNSVNERSLTRTIHSTLTQSAASNTNDSLDLYSVVKASQAVSGELILSSLLEKMMALVLENAGAQKGILIKCEADKLFVEATATLEETKLYLTEKIALAQFDQASDTVINFVARSREVTIIANTALDSPFAKDTYIKQNQIKSVLCYPLINQQSLTGILYLENNLVEGAFTPDRVKVLEMLASQLAAAIDNAHLYSRLETQSEQISHLLEATKDMSSAKDPFEAVSIAISHILAIAPMIEMERAQFYIHQKNAQSFTGYCIWEDGEPIENAVGYSIDNNQTEILYKLSSINLDNCTVSIPVASETELFAVLQIEMYQPIEDASSLPDDLIVGIIRSLGLAMENLEGEAKSRLSNLGGMAASIVHDLKNPIGVIQGYATLADENAIEPTLRSEYLGIISKEASRMSDMAHEVLEYSRGEMTLTIKKITSAAFIKDLKITLDPIFDKANITFSCEDRFKGDLYLDVDRIHRVLLNLASNAIDALVNLERQGDQDTFSIIVACHDQKIHISLADNANGIPESIRATLFEPFVTSGKANGTGLGMAIVKKIINAHKGDIDFITEQAIGTTFSIKMPMNLGDALPAEENIIKPSKATLEDQATTQNSAVDPQTNAATDKQQVHILLTEDNIMNQKMIGTFLKKLGFADVDIADNGKQAIVAMSEKHYDLVLMDIEMPEMNGLEATESIRDIESSVLDHQVSIIAMTGHSDQEAINRCMQAGMNDFISKPIKIDHLSQIIDKGLIASYNHDMGDDFAQANKL